MKKNVLVLAALLIGFSTYAQKITLISGDLSSLKGAKIINTEYDYSNMSVGKFSDANDYVNQKVKDYNEDEAGRGDKWKKAWEGDRTGRFEPAFEELANKYLKKANLYIGNEKDSEYKFVVKTTRTEPGFNAYVVKRNAEVDLTIDVYKGDKLIGTIVSKNNPGRTFGMSDFDTGIRIEESYAKAGKEFGNWLYKKHLK